VIAHIESQRTDHQIPVAVSLRALDLSESWFYKHQNRPATPAQQRRDELDKAIVAEGHTSL